MSLNYRVNSSLSIDEYDYQKPIQSQQSQGHFPYIASTVYILQDSNNVNSDLNHPPAL